MRAVHQHGAGFSGALFAERIAVVPDCAGVGTRIRSGNCGHTTTLRSGLDVTPSEVVNGVASGK
ncbi:hypothetical protein NJB1728216S_41490 [Mycobacterium marinum]|nr:hypothetical protein NJB1808e29_34400 [Mycobacterium marinum]GJO10918.1 hypothetical protein NJB1907f34b_43920 [Mycobacterium marinum]GJO29866.1 hypothetical protein NJB1728e18_44710 [Mycobacterium marinum]GJO46971.1 hypothetical protein NJB1728e24_37150 [Mycobacterium marinum]GJO63985.1 hypothetical protein NJB1728f10_29590 [Mycobacterium marinum]